MADDKSRVLTLVFTDLADSTALKTARGDVAVGELISRHREHVTRLARECTGRIIDWAGDGCFLTFETSSAGAMFALRLQQAHADDSGLPGVRVGLHMGEVTEKPNPEGDAAHPRVEGLAVDIAARISGLAKPGQVLMSASVYNSARQRLGVEAFGQPILWQAHGTYELKGFDEPMEIREAGLEGVAPLVAPLSSEKAKLIKRAKKRKGEAAAPRERAPVPAWAIGLIVVLVAALAYVLGGRRAPAPVNEGGGAADAGSITSLAVLPLDNLMNDPEQDYFADGMTEAITAELAKIKALKVISRTSVMRFKETQLSMPEIAAELGVEGLIEGSVLRDGDDVRITVQLIDGRTDAHLWSESYTDTVTSVLRLQAEVALAIAREIEVSLTADEKSTFADAGPVNPEAYEQYLRGTYFYYDFTLEALEKSQQAFLNAIEIDPGFAEGHAWLAQALWVKGWWFEYTEGARLRTKKAVADALTLDTNNAQARVVSGWTAMTDDWDWPKAEREFRAALDINPNHPDALNALAFYMSSVGRFDEAIAAQRRAIELDPLSATWRVFLAEHLRRADRHEEALAEIQAALELDPNYWVAHDAYAITLTEMGRTAEANEYIDSALETLGRMPSLLVAAVRSRMKTGDTQSARTMVDDLDRRVEKEPIPPSLMASVHAEVGDWEEAYRWLDRAADERDNSLSLPHSGAWRPFWGDTRFNALLGRMNYPGPLPEVLEDSSNAPIEKIAVLPFENISNDAEQEYFVDGMTEALIAELAKIKSIKVISRTSAMRYKGTDKSLTTIARELDVDGIVEGSVLKAGNDVRITAQLINGRTDEHLWAESYTNTLENVLRVQAEVALAIADEVDAVVTQDERTRIASAPAIDSRAYALYIEGRALWSERTAEGFEAAIDRYERALEIDPNFALGHLGLADTYMQQADYFLVSPIPAYERAWTEIEIAFALGEPPGEAYSSRARYKMLNDLDWAGSLADFERAIELNPADPTARLWYGVVLEAVGRDGDMLREMETAVELDPFSPVIVGYHLQQLADAGSTEEALQRAEEVELEFPRSARVAMGLALTYAELGQCDDATAAAQRGYDMRGGDLAGSVTLANVLAMCGDGDAARALLAVLEPVAEERQTAATWIASVYAVLGERDRVFEWLERAIEWRDPGLAGIANYTDFKPLYDDPQFLALVDRLNLSL